MRDRTRPEQTHIGDEELVLLANAEMTTGRSAQAQQHLDECSVCRTKLEEIQQAIEDFAVLRRTELDPEIPPIHASRAELRRRISGELTSERAWLESLRVEPSGIHLVWGLAALLAVATAATLSLWPPSPAQMGGGDSLVSPLAPNPRLTPGLAAPLSRAEVCSAQPDHEAPTVRRALALQVFRSYGIINPQPGAYEVDYVIPPELGGREDVRNLWPQPYDVEPWNAHAKDALEDYLVRSVCEGTVSVKTAQRELAAGWITAYKRHFGVAEPMVEHASFLRDEPWR